MGMIDAAGVDLAADMPSLMAGTLHAAMRNIQGGSLVKGAPGVLYSLSAFNVSGALTYLQIFDAASVAAVTLGTTVPALEYSMGNGVATLPPLPDCGIAFTNGIVVAATTTEMGATPSAAGVHAFLGYF